MKEVTLILQYSHSERKMEKKKKEEKVYPIRTAGMDASDNLFPSPVQSAAIRSFSAVPVHTQSPPHRCPEERATSPAKVTHLLSLSRVSSVSVRSKQLPALGPSYGRKERTQALSHSSRMRAHCRRVTKRELKGSEDFKNT